MQVRAINVIKMIHVNKSRYKWSDTNNGKNNQKWKVLVQLSTMGANCPNHH